jgi:hypothetical protein
VVELLSGVEPFGVVLFGVELDDGLVVLVGLVEFVSVLLELLVDDGEVASVLLLVLLDVEVEFMSELLLLVDGEVVELGEVEVLEPVWLDDVDGVLWLLCAPLASGLVDELLLLLCAMAMPVEKITAVAIVRSFLLMRSVLLSA